MTNTQTAQQSDCESNSAPAPDPTPLRCASLTRALADMSAAMSKAGLAPFNLRLWNAPKTLYAEATDGESFRVVSSFSAGTGSPFDVLVSPVRLLNILREFPGGEISFTPRPTELVVLHGPGEDKTPHKLETKESYNDIEGLSRLTHHSLGSLESVGIFMLTLPASELLTGLRAVSYSMERESARRDLELDGVTFHVGLDNVLMLTASDRLRLGVYSLGYARQHAIPPEGVTINYIAVKILLEMITTHPSLDVFLYRLGDSVVFKSNNRFLQTMPIHTVSPIYTRITAPVRVADFVRVTVRDLEKGVLGFHPSVTVALQAVDENGFQKLAVFNPAETKQDAITKDAVLIPTKTPHAWQQGHAFAYVRAGHMHDALSACYHCTSGDNPCANIGFSTTPEAPIVLESDDGKFRHYIAQARAPKPGTQKG